MRRKGFQCLRGIAAGAGVALAAVLFIGGQAQAATATGSFPVSLTIQASCTVSSTTTLAFGSTSAITSNVDSSSTLGIQCTNTTPYTIALSAGGGSGATVSTRLLSTTVGATTYTIPYTIYQDSGRTQLWGVTTGTDTVGSTGTGAVQNFTAFGRVPPVSAPVVGAYTDTVSVTVTY